MKQGFTTWAPPVLISLLLHVAVVAFYLHQPQRQATLKSDTLLVEMQSIAAKPAAPPVRQPQIKPAPRIEPVKPAEPEPAPAPQAMTPAPVPAAVTAPAIASTATTATTAPEVQPLSRLTRPPAFLRKIDPVYPPGEQRTGSQAFVLAEITLDANGKLLDVKILKSAGKLFDEAVLEAVRNSEFQPGYIESKPVAVRVQIPFRFKLK